MEITIVQNMPIPRAKNGRAGSGSRYNAIIDQVSAGDCVQFKERGQQRYFWGLLRRRGVSSTTRKHDGMYCVWITA